MILYKEESYRIIGACMAVHQKLGTGFSEAVYQEALEIEFAKTDIPFRSKVKLGVEYDRLILKKYFIADFICYDKIVVELKSLSFIPVQVHYQVLNYLKVTGFNLGILVNFGRTSLEYKRIVN